MPGKDGGAGMSEQSTYVRKIGERRFEYGFVKYAKNFRKHSDAFSPVGVESSATAAAIKADALAAKTEVRL
jgi:hypothetical protein